MNTKKEIIQSQNFLTKKSNLIFIFYSMIIISIMIIAYKGLVPDLISSIPFYDKIGHFFLVGFLSYLFNMVLNGKKAMIWKMYIPLAPLLVFTFFTVDEFFQLLSTVRTFDFFDLLANFLGIIFFYFLES